MLYIVSIEIHSARQRTRIIKTLEGFGAKVQKNLFEFHLDKTQSAKFIYTIKECSAILQPKDQIRIYQICEKCKKQILFLGSAKLTIEPIYYIV